MNKNILVPIVVGVVFTGVGFSAGAHFAKSKTRAFPGSDQRQQMFRSGNGGRGLMGGPGGGMMMGGFTAGEIISKDAQSITVKLRDGGSKVVFVSGSTKIEKPTEAKLEDLTEGTQVLVTGSANSDGSLAAQSVQVRPALPAEVK